MEVEILEQGFVPMIDTSFIFDNNRVKEDSNEVKRLRMQVNELSERVSQLEADLKNTIVLTKTKNTMIDKMKHQIAEQNKQIQNSEKIKDKFNVMDQQYSQLQEKYLKIGEANIQLTKEINTKKNTTDIDAKRASPDTESERNGKNKRCKSDSVVNENAPEDSTTNKISIPKPTSQEIPEYIVSAITNRQRLPSGRYMWRVEWNNGDITWEPIENLCFNGFKNAVWVQYEKANPYPLGDNPKKKKGKKRKIK